jgi:putative oxidoreductase
VSKSHESTAAFDFPITGTSRVVCAPAAAHHRVGFMQHGYAKLARGPEDFINVLHAMGLPVPFVLGWATIVVELVGGLMILAGALIPLATVPMAIVLLVAIFTVHLPNGFGSIKLQSFDAAGAHFGQPGYETDLLYLAGLVALCFGGPGPISVDGLLNRLKKSAAAKA